MLNLKPLAGIGYLALASAGFAQFGPLPQNMSMDYFPILFMNPKVVSDMHLSPAVAQKEQSILIQAIMSMASSVGSKNANQAEIGKKALSALSKTQTASLAPLTGPQKVRYHQLTLQYFGPPALLWPGNAKQVGLTSAQQSKLSKAMEESERSLSGTAQGMARGGQSNAIANYQKLQSSQAATKSAQEKTAQKILTPAQWAKWDAMQGKKLPGITNILGGMGMGMG